MAESISEFELSSESEDNGDTCCQSDFGDDDINVEDDGCHDDTSVHECNISDSQSIISVTRLLALKLHTFLLVEGYSAKFGHSVLFVEKLQKPST